MATASEIQAKVDKLTTNLDRLDGVVNGPAEGASSEVTIDGGLKVKTLARLALEGQVQVDDASGSAAAAAASAAEAEASANTLSATSDLLGLTTVDTGQQTLTSTFVGGLDGYGWRIDRPQVITSVVIGTKITSTPASGALAVLRPNEAGTYDCLHYSTITSGLTNTTASFPLEFNALADDVVLFIPLAGCEMRRATSYAGSNVAMIAADPPTAVGQTVAVTTLSGAYPALKISGTILAEVEALQNSVNDLEASDFALNSLLDRTTTAVGTIGTGATISSNTKAYGWLVPESGLLTSVGLNVTDPGDGFLIHARPAAGGVETLAREAVSYGDNAGTYETSLVVQKGDYILFQAASGGFLRRDTAYAGSDVAFSADSPPTAVGNVFDVATMAPLAPSVRLDIQAYRTLNRLTAVTDAPVHRATAAAGFTADRALIAGASIIHQEALVAWDSSPDAESIDLQRLPSVEPLDDTHFLMVWQQRLAGRIETGGSTAYVGDAKFIRLVSAEFEVGGSAITLVPGSYQVMDAPATEEHVSNHPHLYTDQSGVVHCYFNSNDHTSPVETGKYRVHRRKYDKALKTWGARELVSSPQGAEINRALGSNGTVVRITSGTNAGRVLLPVYCTSPAFAGVLYSDDDADTFVMGGKFGGGYQEPAIVETSSGRILMDLRRADNPGYRHFAESADDGISFVDLGLQTDLTSPEVACSMIGKGLTGGLDGAAAIIHMGPSLATRQNMRLRLSWDDGRSFPWQYAFAALADDVVGQPDDLTGYTATDWLSDGRLIAAVERVDNAKFAPSSFGVNGRSEIDVAVLNVAEIMANGGPL